MPQLAFGIVGTGLIANVIADAIAQSAQARLAAVSSRRLAHAQRFVEKRQGVVAIEGVPALLARSDVDAVYVATPTVAKEEIALGAIAAGKHMLVDKPFASLDSVKRMIEAATAKGVVFMDATHFVHHPRTAAIRTAIPERIGSPRFLHTMFYWPLNDHTNIRFDVKQEPMTALGDLAWYSMRAVVEYLRPKGRITQAITMTERDQASAAILNATGMIAFESGEVSTFGVGYTAGTLLMDLQLVGTKGVMEMDDFVLDWTNSFAFKNPDIKAGYRYRTGVVTPKDVTLVPTAASTGQEVQMIDNFAHLAASGDAQRRTSYTKSALKTQEYLDALWHAAESSPAGGASA